MQKQIVERALDFVKTVFGNDYGGHDYFHTFRVYKMAGRIAEAEGADMETVLLAALLHDVDDRKLSPGTHENKDRARAFLKENGADEEWIERICRIIGEISFGDGAVPGSLEGRCVQDADRLDAIGAIGVGRAFAYGGSHDRPMYDPDVPPKMNMTKEEYRNSKSTTINHFYEKLFLLRDLLNTDTARQIAGQREAFMKDFIEEFMAEWNGVR